MIREPYLIHGSLFQADLKSLGEVLMNAFGPVTVPDGKYFVMGDNRDVSLDSRSEDVGLSDQSKIVGKALFVYGTDRQGKSIY